MTNTNRTEAPVITLNVHICDQRRSYNVIFEGSNAEDMALAFMAQRSTTHAIGEVVLTERYWESDPYGGDGGRWMYEAAPEQPHLINASVFPRLYEALNPTCEHGMSASLCFGPSHYVRDDELAQGW